MINAIYGKKVGMTQVWTEDDRVVAVTVIQAEPNKVCQVKTTETDGYEAVQLGFGAIKAKKVNKPMAGHFAKQGVERASSAVTASVAAPAATAPTSTALPAPSACAPRRPAFSRACAWPATWAATR